MPLFLKLPGQTRGAASEADVQHIDLMATLADVLGMEFSGPQQGRSMFAPNPPPRRKVAYDPRNGRLEFADTLGLAPLNFTLEVPAAGSSPWVGQRVSTFRVIPLASAGTRVFPVTVLPAAGPGAGPVVYVSGQIDPALRPARVVVAVNGEIVADTSQFHRSAPGGRLFWNIAFPARALRADTHAVAAYAVRSETDRRLVALPTPADSTLPRNGGG